MPLQFILGSSGAGKTRLLCENLIEMSMEQPEGQFTAIVLKQFTMQIRRKIVTLYPDHGIIDTDTVSLEWLAYRVPEGLAVTTLDILDDTGKSMVLRKMTVEQKRDPSLFRGHLNQNGFIDQLRSMISGPYQYGTRTEEPDMAVEEDESALLQEKLKDLSVIYKGSQREIEEQYITAEEVLDVPRRVLLQSETTKNSVVTLNGYTGFTPVQYQLLELLFIYARKVIVTVTVDPASSLYKKSRVQNLLYMGRQIVYRLTDLAPRNGITEEDGTMLGAGGLRRSANSPAIGFLEQHLYRYGNTCYGKEQKEMSVYQAGKPGQGVAWVVGQIHRLVQRKQVRYREVVVTIGDLPSYGRELINRFEAKGTPHFMDDKKSILENAMAEPIRTALGVVQKDFSYESAFRYPKTGLVTDRREMIDRLDNYVMALGTRGYKKWNQTWRWECRGSRHLNLTELNEFREEVLGPLFRPRESLREEEVTVDTMVKAVMDCLVEYQVEQKSEGYRRHFEETGEYSLAKEYGQVYGSVMGLSERMVHLPGDEKISRKGLAEVLDVDFGKITVGMIPTMMDRVVVSNLTRTRLDEIQVLFSAGVNDGVAPTKKNTSGILASVSRSVLK